MDRTRLTAARALTAFAVAIVLPLTAGAETRDLLTLSLEELGNIPITGSTLTEKNLRDVPASVSVFTAAEIHKLPVHTLTDLMNYVPGLQAFRNSDTSITQSGSVRGLRESVSDREILVLLNGMKIDNYFTGGSNASYANLPLDNVRRIEFIRGPGSAVYGSNAFTGVINIITNDADRNSVALNAGNFGHLQASLQAGAQSGNIDMHLLATATHEHGEHYLVDDPFGNGTVGTRDSRYHGSAQLQVAIAQDTRLQWVYADNHSDGFYTLGTVDDDFNRFDTVYSGLQLTQGLHWHPRIDSQLLLSVQYSDLQIDNHPVVVVNPAAISSPSSSDPILVKADISSIEYSLNWKNDWTLAEDSSLQFGLEYRNPRLNKGKAWSNYDIAQLANQQLPINYYGDFSHFSRILEPVRSDIVSLYTQYQHQFNATWETLAGARYDQYSQIGGHFSPRLALIAHANERDTFKWLYGQAFRAPQAPELYTINNPVQLGNPGLKPETVATWELIWLHEWQASQLVLNYFYNDFKHGISLQPVNNIRLYTNSHQRDHSDGVEAEWTSRLNDEWQMHLTATHLLDMPNSFYHEARTLFSGALMYEHANWYGTVSTQYRSSRQTIVQSDGTRRKLDHYWLWQAKLGYHWKEALELYGEVLNALDKDYYTPTTTTRIQDGIPNRGRELQLGFTWDY